MAFFFERILILQHFYTSAKYFLLYCSFADRFLEAFWRRCQISSRFSLSQFFLFLRVIPDGLEDREIRSEHWLITPYPYKNRTGLLQLMAKGNVY